jgi:hypothetical protein
MEHKKKAERTPKENENDIYLELCASIPEI